MFVSLQTYLSFSPSSLWRWHLRLSWYPYWWWLWSFVHEGHGHTCCLSSMDGNQLLMSCRMYSAQLEHVENVQCTGSCYRHRTMAADTRHSTWSFQFASCADLVNFRSRPNMMTTTDLWTTCRVAELNISLSLLCINERLWFQHCGEGVLTRFCKQISKDTRQFIDIDRVGVMLVPLSEGRPSHSL